MDQLLSLNSAGLPASALGPLHLTPPGGISLPPSSAHAHHAQQMHAHLNGLLGGMHLPHHPPLHSAAPSSSPGGGAGCPPPPPPPLPLPPPPSHPLLPPPPPLLSPSMSSSRPHTPSQNNFQVRKNGGNEKENTRFLFVHQFFCFYIFLLLFSHIFQKTLLRMILN